MDKNRKKEMLEQYKQMRSQMGIFMIRCKVNHKCYIQTTQDLKGLMNSTEFKLAAGIYTNKGLQKEWKDFGSENFTIEILETLEYDQDESKTDYTEDLALLQMMWEEKLINENFEFYKKRI